MAAKGGVQIQCHSARMRKRKYKGVNNRVQLAELERWYQLQRAEWLMVNGANLADPSRIDVRGNVNIGQDLIDRCECRTRR